MSDKPNTSDKRSVSTDALDTLGTVPIGKGSGRDAIHLAVEPVVADERLYPGQDIRVDNGYASTSKPHLGIVDPFIKGVVMPGDRFWMVVYPRQITSLRHVWDHPAFPSEPVAVEAVPVPSDLRKAVEWMENYAKRIEVNYDELIARARDYREGGDYWSEGGRFEGMSVPDEFWNHYAEITGDKTFDLSASFFSCSC